MIKVPQLPAKSGSLHEKGSRSMETGILILTAATAGVALFCGIQLIRVNQRLQRLESQNVEKKLAAPQTALAEQERQSRQEIVSAAQNAVKFVGEMLGTNQQTAFRAEGQKLDAMNRSILQSSRKPRGDALQSLSTLLSSISVRSPSCRAASFQRSASRFPRNRTR